MGNALETAPGAKNPDKVGTRDAGADIALFEDNDGYHEREVLRLTLNLLRHTKRDSAFASRLFAGFEKEFDIDGFPSQRDGKKTFYSHEKKALKPVNEADWNTVQEYLERKFADAPDTPPDLMSRNLARLADYLGLDETGKALLDALYVIEKRREDEGSIFSKAIAGKAKVPDALALMLDRPGEKQKIAKLVSPNGPLLTNGLVYYDIEDDEGIFPELDGSLWRSLGTENISELDIVGSLLGQPGKTDLTTADFRHFGTGVDKVTRLIGNAIEKGEKGVNVLIYGGAGLGKTQLAYAIAKKLGVEVYAVGETEEEDEGFYDSPPPKKSTSEMRIAQLRRAQALLEGNKKAFLVFDEVEDLLIKGEDSTKKADTESKIATNRLLEKNAVVTLWIGNNPEKFHEAVRQRFSYALRAVDAPTLIRKDIWERRLQLENVALPEADTLDLARKYSAPPRLIGDAIHNMVLLGGGREELEDTLEAKAEIVYGHRDSIILDNALPKTFSPGMINFTDGGIGTLQSLVERGAANKPFSLAVKQEKGAGGNYLLRYMAEKMTMNLVETSAQELLTPTQQTTPADNIRLAFQTASDERALLVINDADLLASSEARAVLPAFTAAALRHKLPYALVGKKDMRLPDSLERLLSDQIGLGALTAEQSGQAYKAHFGREAPAGLAAIKGLTVETFVQVGNVLRFHGEATNADDEKIVKKLERQASTAEAGRAGFHAPQAT